MQTHCEAQVLSISSKMQTIAGYQSRAWTCSGQQSRHEMPTRQRRTAAHRQRSVHVAASDVNCRDVVGVRREIQSQGKVFTIKLLGSGSETREIQCQDDEYILDAAERQGIDLPATCRGGICGACVARVAKGTIDQSDIPDLEFTVSQEEQEKGMALLCMTRATSDLDVETQCDWGYSLGVGDWKGATGRFEAAPDPLMGKSISEFAKQKEAATASSN